MRHLILYALLPLLISTCLPKSANQKPNVLFILVDDLNDWQGINKSHPLVQTPNLDRFFESAVYFSNAHCATPICQASRNALMTGIAPHISGWYSNYRRANYDQPNDISGAIHLPELLRKNGYKTMAAGKIYHSGVSDIRQDSLWDEYIGLDAWHWKKPAYFTELGVNYDKRFQPFPERGGRILSDLGIKAGFSLCGGPAPEEELPEGKMHDTFITDWAIEKLAEAHEQPFFLAIGYHRPHVPYTAPARYFEMYPLEQIQLPDIPDDEFADIPLVAKAMAVGLIPGGDHAAVMQLGEQFWKELIQAYLACITFVDDEIGRLLGALQESGLSDNTIVVLLSDHGQNLGEKRNWRKMCLWEESTRVPLAFLVPGKGKNGQNPSPASLLDIYPTLADLLDFKKPTGLSGKSLAQFILNPGETSETPVVTTWLYGNHSVRSIRHRFTQYRDGTLEFYDHQTDPDERFNLAGDPAYANLIAWHRDYLPEENANPVDTAEARQDRLDEILKAWEDEGIPEWLK